LKIAHSAGTAQWSFGAAFQKPWEGQVSKTVKALFAMVMAGLLALGALWAATERQRQTELNRHSEEKQADERVESLQPEDIIRVCGKPFSDKRPISGRRELKYKTHHVDPRKMYFSLEFRSDGARWQFQPNHSLLIVKDQVDWAFKTQFPCVSDAARKYGKTLAQRGRHEPPTSNHRLG